jgi:hypothetical protein
VFEALQQVRAGGDGCRSFVGKRRARCDAVSKKPPAHGRRQRQEA